MSSIDLEADSPTSCIGCGNEVEGDALAVRDGAVRDGTVWTKHSTLVRPLCTGCLTFLHESMRPPQGPKFSPDHEKCVERMRMAFDHAVEDDPLHHLEIDLQHAVAALGRSPAHLYPDDDMGPEYWYDAENWPDDPQLAGGTADD